MPGVLGDWASGECERLCGEGAGTDVIHLRLLAIKVKCTHDSAPLLCASALTLVWY